jgi:hypothetical protein
MGQDEPAETAAQVQERELLAAAFGDEISE